MTDEKKSYERFGKYLILDHLFDGGMAKICRARHLGEQAFKIVAIKMVQPQYSKDPAYVKMFNDELKVTFSLQHPNIAAMYDYGMVNDQLFTTMELVDGANLKQYLDRLKAKKFAFPVPASIYIISQVCQALYYAHTFSDKMTGKKLNIVHRDISPHNIMLSYDGAIKVIDFGIAKADSNSEKTQAGTIKGKLSYLAPEYLDGLDLDPRYDEFAVGITLWEMLCSRKLFTAANDLAVLKQIQACKIPPPSSINPNVPKELDEIVLKALSKDRAERYEDMDKFNRALVKFLYSKYPDFNATDLRYFANQLFEEEIKKNKQLNLDYGKIDIRPYLEEMRSNSNKATSSNQNSDRPVSGEAPARGSTQIIEFDMESSDESGGELELGIVEPTTTRRHPNKEATQTRRHSTQNGSATESRGTSSTGINRGTKKLTRKVSTSRSRKIVHKNTRHNQSSGNGKVFIIAASIVLGFVYVQSDMVSKLIGVDVSGMLGKTSTSRNVAQDDTNTTGGNNGNLGMADDNGTISLIGYESDMEVFVNGQRMKLKGFDMTVPFNKELNIKITKPGYRPYNKSGISLSQKNSFMNLLIPDMVKEKIGLLSTSQNYTTGSKLVFQLRDGMMFDKKLPLTNERVPAGMYEGVIKNPLLGTEKKVQFTIEENKRFFLD